MKAGLRAVCIREVQKSLDQSVKLLIEDKIKKFGVGSYFRVLNTHIETPGGGLIIFQGMQNHTAESIKSLEGYHIAWCEEAQSLSQRSLDMLRPTIREPGSELWFSWNPKSDEDPVDNFLRCNSREAKEKHLKPHPSSIVVEANWQDNPWFPEMLRQERDYDQRRDPDKYLHVWLGQYQRNSQAAVFRNWRIEEFQTPDDARFYYGADWGFSVDPTVLVRCWIKDRTLYVDHEAWQIGCEIDRTPALFDQIENGHARKWPIKADSSDPQNISYMARHGFPNITPSIKGPNSVEQGVEFLKSYEIIVHPRCKHVADELATYSYEVDKQTEEVLPKLADKKNHTIDSLRYAIEGVRRAGPTMTIANYGHR